MKQSLAPIALFVYNRLDHTKTTIEYLKQNPLSEDSILYVFSDGGRDQQSWREVNKVRQYLPTISGFRGIHIVERPENYYIERNVVEGVAEVLKAHESIIVLEDDIKTSPVFLQYMNAALHKYNNEPRVMHVASFTHLDLHNYGDTYFSPYMSGYGAWATWRDRWQHFHHYTSRIEALDGMSDEMIDSMTYGGSFAGLSFLDRSPIPWDICWSIDIRKCNGLCLHPTHTLVRNIGLTKGTHFNHSRLFGWFEYDRPVRTEPIVLRDIPIESNPDIEHLYTIALKDHGMRYNWFGKIVRAIYLTFFKTKS